MRLKTVFVVLLQSLYFLVQSQSDCLGLIKNEYKDIYQINSEAEIYNNFNLLFELEETKLDEYADSYENGDELSGMYKAASIFWSKNRKKDNFRKEFREYKERYKMGFILNNKFYDNYYSSTVNTIALQKFIDCKQIEANKEIELEKLKVYTGGIYHKTVGDLSNTFTVVLKKKPAPGHPEKVKIINVTPNNLEFQNAFNLKPNAILENYTGIAQNMKLRNPKNSASLIINFENYDPIEIEFPSTASPRYPLGTIIISVLDFNAFSKETKSYMPFDESISKWAPADGRNIRNSEYGKGYNEFAPDLRGQFLRGNNQMFGPGESKEFVNGKDIGNRSTINNYSYQNDATKRPNSIFEIRNSGAHYHEFKGDEVSLTGDGFPNTSTLDRGNGNTNPKHTYTPRGKVTEKHSLHNHKIEFGGDKETRPKNISVYYYIRINN